MAQQGAGAGKTRQGERSHGIFFSHYRESAGGRQPGNARQVAFR